MSIIPVTCSSMPDYAEYCEEIKELWDSHWLTNMGCKHKQFEDELKAYLNTPNITLFVNGHLALETVIAAMNLPSGSEVITTPFTFASTTHAIVRNGLKPVFCDINPDDFTIDTSKIEALITDKTSAIVPVHVYGNICNVEQIQILKDRYGLKVIYDAAHAFGVTYKGISAANYGDASMLSFHATKVFNTIEGGAACYSDEHLMTVLNDLKNFGIRGPESVAYVGGNAKMNEFVAAMGICNLRHLDGEIEKRSRVFKHYYQCLNGIPGLRFSAVQRDVKPNYSYFPVVFDGFKLNRDEVFAKLAAHGIKARKYFYPLANGFECYKGLDTAGEDKTPIAQYIADRVLTLPMYANLSIEDVDRICDIILN